MISWDTETALFRPGVRSPELVCVTWKTRGKEPQIKHVTEVLPTIKDWFDISITNTLVGHNVAYDCAVLCAQFPELIPAIFNAYDKDRITCTKIRQQLLDIAAGQFRGYADDNGEWHAHNYDLDSCLYRAERRRLDKDTWRLRYGEFRDIPLKDWPEGARLYPLEDAVATEAVAVWQDGQADQLIQALVDEIGLVAPDPLADQFRQSRAAFALYLTQSWGMRTDAQSVAEFEAATRADYDTCEKVLKEAGLIRADGSADTKVAKQRMVEACAEEGIEPLRTKGGDISLGAEACERIQDGLIKTYSDFLTLRKVLTNDVELLRKGTIFPVHPGYNLADTGRTTCSDPNIQALRKAKGIRESFRPRPGKVFIQADFPSLELHTLADWCMEVLGFSRLCEIINSGTDPLLQFAADRLGITYDEAKGRLAAKDKQVKEMRQGAKAALYGLPGGLGDDKFIKYADATFNVQFTKDEAKKIRADWHEMLPEMKPFFKLAADACRERKVGWEIQPTSKRVSGGARYTSLCNRRFQGRGADAAKQALWEVTKKCYLASLRSDLFGSRPVAFVHDEIIAESDLAVAHLAALELGKTMAEGANKILRHCPFTHVESQIMTVWSKDAEPIYDTAGKLIPWSPK